VAVDLLSLIIVCITWGTVGHNKLAVSLTLCRMFIRAIYTNSLPLEGMDSRYECMTDSVGYAMT